MVLVWIQKAIPERFPFLLKSEDDNVSVHPINNFLAHYGISSYHLRKIGADHASRVHGGKNDSRRRQLACRHKIGHALSVEYYGVMNDPRSEEAFASKPDAAAEMAEIIDLYNY